MGQDGPKISDSTKVDLGEDLLEATKKIEIPKQETPPVGDDFQRAEILFNEHFFEDAKKILRKMLRENINDRRATDLLNEIQKLEIQELLSTGDTRRKLGAEEETTQSTQMAIAQLEQDLQISIDKAELKAIPDLFTDEMMLTRYKENIQKLVSKLTNRERMDLGVAYFEMGLFDLAASIFEVLQRHTEYNIVGTYLLCLAQIYGGKAIEASIQLEPFVRDLTLPENYKLDFLYLMALAFEKLGDRKKSREFYRRVKLINPRYRDVLEKLK